jgi:hypothetical protein
MEDGVYYRKDTPVRPEGQKIGPANVGHVNAVLVRRMSPIRPSPSLQFHSVAALKE